MEQPCPQCGHYVPDTEEFCPNPSCGAYLGWHREETPDDLPPRDPSPRVEPLKRQPTPRLDADDHPGPRFGDLSRDQPPARTSHVASLSTQRLDVAPGGIAELTVTVTNTGTIVDEVEIAVASQVASCASVMPSAVQVYPGQHATAQVTVSAPPDDGLWAGTHPLVIRLTSSRGEGRSELQAAVVVAAQVGMTARLVPPQTSGRSVRFQHRVELENHGNTPLHVTLQPRDDYGRVRWPRLPRATVVRPGRTETTELAARTRRNWRGGTDAHPFEVTAHGEPEADDGEAVDQRLQGRRDQEATLSGWRVRALAVTLLAGLLLVLAPFGLALLRDDGGSDDDGGVDAPSVEAEESGNLALPDFTGSNSQEATNELEEAGLQVALVERFSDEDAGTVLEQDPAPQTPVEQGSTVTLAVSVGQSPNALVCTEVAATRELVVEQGLSDDSSGSARDVVDSAAADGVDSRLVSLAGAVSSALEAQDEEALDTALDEMASLCGQ